MNKLPVYLIFGSGGVLGQAFLERFNGAGYTYRVFPFDHQKADITEPSHINPLMEYVRPSVVINCASVSDPDLCQDAKTGAFSVNAKGPGLLAESCKKFGAKLVHFSTCEVFDGSGCTPYSERHAAKPLNILGQSKLSGEQAIRDSLEDYLIVRPGWVFSYQFPSMVPGWIEQADRNEEIKVLDDTLGSPTYTVDLVDATVDLLTADAKGIFHVANSEAASLQSFVEATLELSGVKTPVTVMPRLESRQLRSPTPRYAALSTKKYSQTTGKPIRTWVDALKHCLFNMNRYKP